MRMLITGGAGMVGSHAAEYFAQQGYEVVVFDALMRSALVGAHRQSVEHNWTRLQRIPHIQCVCKVTSEASRIYLTCSSSQWMW